MHMIVPSYDRNTYELDSVQVVLMYSALDEGFAQFGCKYGFSVKSCTYHNLQMSRDRNSVGKKQKSIPWTYLRIVSSCCRETSRFFVESEKGSVFRSSGTGFDPGLMEVGPEIQ